MSIAISTVVFYEKNKHLFGSTLDWTADVIKAVFLSDAHVPDPATHQYYDDVDGDAVSTPATLDNLTAAADGATGEGVLNADDENNITVSGAWQYVAVMKWVIDETDSPLLFYGDAGSSQASGTLDIVWSADGVVRIV